MIFLYIELFEQIGFSAEKSIREVKDVNESIHSLQKASVQVQCEETKKLHEGVDSSYRM